MDNSILGISLIILSLAVVIPNIIKLFFPPKRSYFKDDFIFIVSLHGPGENKNKSGLSYKGIENLLKKLFSSGKISSEKLDLYNNILDSSRKLEPENNLDYSLRDDLNSGNMENPVYCNKCNGILEPLFNNAKICRDCYAFINPTNSNSSIT
ncbi:hypothetical protein HY745_06760 [Candidatus Desantisbacteria bacterium]|nr:hypothetical protein [Candidatus Desantisbacteria bacterium]